MYESLTSKYLLPQVGPRTEPDEGRCDIKYLLPQVGPRTEPGEGRCDII